MLSEKGVSLKWATWLNFVKNTKLALNFLARPTITKFIDVDNNYVFPWLFILSAKLKCKIVKARLQHQFSKLLRK